MVKMRYWTKNGPAIFYSKISIRCKKSQWKRRERCLGTMRLPPNNSKPFKQN